MLAIFALSLVAMQQAISTASGQTSQSEYTVINSGVDPVPTWMIFPTNASWKDPNVECLIVTNNAIADAFWPLANLKTQRGCNTQIITIESIEANATFTKTGSSLMVWIRNAIKYFHYTKGTEFVILGGGVDIIPTCYVYYGEQGYPLPESDIPGDDHYKPTDHYYADLVGTWNDMNNSEYGVMNTLNTYNGTDEINWTAQVYVGRFPVENAAEASVMVQKDIDYELNPPAGSWLDSAIFAGAVSEYQTGSTPSVNEAEMSEYMIDNYVPSTVNVTRVYRCTNDYTPAHTYINLTETNLFAALNQGAAFVNLAGHGSPTTYDGQTSAGSFYGGMYFQDSDAVKMNNSGRLPLMYIFSCDSGMYDYNNITGGGPCMSEDLVTNPDGGAIAVISADRTTYFYDNDTQFQFLNHGQDLFFNQEFFVNHDYQPGRALYLSQEEYISQVIDKYWNIGLDVNQQYVSNPLYHTDQEVFRDNLLSYNLLGDPEIDIYTGAPQNFSTTAIPTTAYVGDTMLLTVRAADGAIVPNADILLNGSGYYINVVADQYGVARVPVPDDAALVGQVMTLTITGHDMLRAQVNVTIGQDTTLPSTLAVTFPAGPLDFLGTFSISATGTENMSGLKYAFVVQDDKNGQPISIQPMKLVGADGNLSTFYYTYPGALPPGGTIRFYIIAFDAGGHFIKTMQAKNQDFVVAVNARNIEESIVYITIFGVPTLSVIIVVSFVLARKHRSKKVSIDDLAAMHTKIDSASDENASSLRSRLLGDNS
jgi:hypothetical protein